MQVRTNTERKEWSLASVDSGINRVDDDNGLGKERARNLARLLHDNPAEFERLIRSWQDDSSSDNMASSFVFGLINALGQEEAQKVLQAIPSDVKQRLIGFLADGSVHDDERSAIAILEQSKAENLSPISTEALDQSDWDLGKAQSAADGVKDDDWPHSKAQAKDWLRQYHDDPLSFINSMRMTGYNEDFDRAAMYFVYGLYDALGETKAREVIDRLPADVKAILVRHLTQDNVYNREQSAADFVRGGAMTVASADDSDEGDDFFSSIGNAVTGITNAINEKMNTAFKNMGPLGAVLAKAVDSATYLVKSSFQLGQIGFYLATLQFDKAAATAREGFDELVQRVYENLPMILAAIPVVGPALAIAYAVGRTAYYAANGDIWMAIETALDAIPAGSGVLGKVARYGKVAVAAAQGIVALAKGRYQESLDHFGNALSRSGAFDKVAALQVPESLQSVSGAFAKVDPAVQMEQGVKVYGEKMATPKPATVVTPKKAAPAAKGKGKGSVESSRPVYEELGMTKKEWLAAKSAADINTVQSKKEAESAERERAGLAFAYQAASAMKEGAKAALAVGALVPGTAGTIADKSSMAMDWMDYVAKDPSTAAKKIAADVGESMVQMGLEKKVPIIARPKEVGEAVRDSYEASSAAVSHAQQAYREALELIRN